MWPLSAYAFVDAWKIAGQGKRKPYTFSESWAKSIPEYVP